jgi:hypothetical protein
LTFSGAAAVLSLRNVSAGRPLVREIAALALGVAITPLGVQAQLVGETVRRCPLKIQRENSGSPMSVLGQKRTSGGWAAMSALWQKRPFALQQKSISIIRQCE